MFSLFERPIIMNKSLFKIFLCFHVSLVYVLIMNNTGKILLNRAKAAVFDGVFGYVWENQTSFDIATCPCPEVVRVLFTS